MCQATSLKNSTIFTALLVQILPSSIKRWDSNQWHLNSETLLSTIGLTRDCTYLNNENNFINCQSDWGRLLLGKLQSKKVHFWFRFHYTEQKNSLTFVKFVISHLALGILSHLKICGIERVPFQFVSVTLTTKPSQNT